MSENLTDITNPASYSWLYLSVGSSVPGGSQEELNFYNTSICYVAVGNNN